MTFHKVLPEQWQTLRLSTPVGVNRNVNNPHAYTTRQTPSEMGYKLKWQNLRRELPSEITIKNIYDI